MKIRTSIAFAGISLLAFSTVQAAQMKQAFSYDAAGRLISVTTDGDCAQASLDERYVYDKSGNITEKVVSGETVRMTYDAANQLMSRTDADGSVDFVYDSAGRLVSEHTDGQVLAQYEYGYLDKVIQVTRGDQVTQFHYNARGMLVAKERDGQIIETFGWDGIGLLAKNETVYANEAHISGGVPLAAIDAGSENAEMQYFDSDYLGTTTAVYSASGEVDTHLASSFGAGTESDELRFTGKPYDADLDAHVFPYRNYKAEVGNWASADPAGFPDGPNQHYYACVPTMGLDPLGLKIIGVGNLSPAGQAAIGNIRNSSYGQSNDSSFNVMDNSTTAHVFIKEGTENNFNKATRTFTFNLNDLQAITIDEKGHSPAETIASIESIIVHEMHHAYDYILNPDSYDLWHEESGEYGTTYFEQRAMEEANGYRGSNEFTRVWYDDLTSYQNYLNEI